MGGNRTNVKYLTKENQLEIKISVIIYTNARSFCTLDF
jgi:hypothetical protein